MVIEAGCIDEHMHGMYHARLCSLFLPPGLHAACAFLRLDGVCFSILFVPVLKVQGEEPFDVGTMHFSFSQYNHISGCL